MFSIEFTGLLGHMKSVSPLYQDFCCKIVYPIYYLAATLTPVQSKLRSSLRDIWIVDVWM